MMRLSVLSALFCSATLLMLGCQGDTIDAGKNDVDDASTYPWKGKVSNSYGIDCPYDAPPAYKGLWKGELAADAERYGSLQVRIDVQGVSTWGLCGTMTFGSDDAEPPALPTNATDPYAPGLPREPSYYENSVVGRLDPIMGFPYEFGRAPPDDAGPLALPVVPDPELGVPIVDISFAQAYKAWCNLQTSYRDLVSGRGFYCLPLGSSGHGTGPDGCSLASGPVSCTQATLCLEAVVCECSTDGCTAGTYGSRVAPTLFFQGDTVTGTMDLDGDPGLDQRTPFTLTRERAVP